MKAEISLVENFWKDNAFKTLHNSSIYGDCHPGIVGPVNKFFKISSLETFITSSLFHILYFRF